MSSVFIRTHFLFYKEKAVPSILRYGLLFAIRKNYQTLLPSHAAKGRNINAKERSKATTTSGVFLYCDIFEPKRLSCKNFVQV